MGCNKKKTTVNDLEIVKKIMTDNKNNDNSKDSSIDDNTMIIINICNLSCYELTLCSLSCCSSLVMSSCARWRLPDFVFNSAVLVSKSFLACFNSFSIFSFFLASRCASLLRTWMSSLSWSSKSKEKIKTTIEG